MKNLIFYIGSIIIFCGSVSNIREIRNLEYILDKANDVLIYRTHVPRADSLQVFDFDFTNFSGSDKGRRPTKIFVEDDQVSELIFKQHETEYDLFFYYSDPYIFFNVLINRNNNRDFAPGFFLIDKEKKKITFFGLKMEFFEDLNLYSGADLDSLSWRFVNTPRPNSVEKILGLNNELYSSSRINCYEGKVLTYSQVIRNKGSLVEFMEILSQCESETALSEMSIDELYYLLDDRSCLSALRLKAKPLLYDNHDFLWSMNGNEYR